MKNAGRFRQLLRGTCSFAASSICIACDGRQVAKAQMRARLNSVHDDAPDVFGRFNGSSARIRGFSYK
jgi:hypothetical protein